MPWFMHRDNEQQDCLRGLPSVVKKMSGRSAYQCTASPGLAPRSEGNPARHTASSAHHRTASAVNMTLIRHADTVCGSPLLLHSPQSCTM